MGAGKKAPKKQKGGSKHRDQWEPETPSNNGSPLFYLGALVVLSFAYFTHQKYPLLNSSTGTPQDLCNQGEGSSLCWRVNASVIDASNKLELNKINHAPRSSYSKPNIGIFQMFSDEIASYAVHSTSINNAYAQKHGYDYMLTRVELTGEVENQHAVTMLPQSKMKYMTDALLTVPEGGWLLWLDTDFAVLREDIPLESFIETHGIEGINVIVCLEYNLQTINTGVLLLRRSDWTFKMLEEWHKVGYSELWSLSELSEWGMDFYEKTGKLPPDQQMHNELSRVESLEYLKHTSVLETTIMNSRWPAWALDNFDSPVSSKSQLQFGLHLFGTTKEERDIVFEDLHRRLRQVDESRALSELHPSELSLAIAAHQLTALGQRASEHPRRSFANAELCVALYTWIGGPGPVSHLDGDAPFHRAYRLSDRHLDCLDPGIAAEVAKFMIQRRNLDAAYFALKVTMEVSELLLETKAPVGSTTPNSLDPEAEKSLSDNIEKWREQMADVELARTSEKTFFLNRESPGTIKGFGTKKPSRREMRERAKKAKNPSI